MIAMAEYNFDKQIKLGESLQQLSSCRIFYLPVCHLKFSKPKQHQLSF